MEKKSVMKSEVNYDNSSGTISVGFGVLSLLFALMLPPFGIILSFLALGFSISQSKKSKNSWSKAGFILFIIGLIFSVIVWVLTATLISQYGSQLGI